MRAVKQFGERRFTPAMREADKGKQKSDVDEFRWESGSKRRILKQWSGRQFPHISCQSISFWISLDAKWWWLRRQADGRKITPMGRPWREENSQSELANTSVVILGKRTDSRFTIEPQQISRLINLPKIISCTYHFSKINKCKHSNLEENLRLTVIVGSIK